jgi:two-component sensor histidine kinase
MILSIIDKDMGSRSVHRNNLKWALFFNAGIIFIFIITSIVIFKNIDSFTMSIALHEAKIKANMIMTHHLSTHTYFSKQLKPVVFSELSDYHDKNYFSPQWMSSTYAVREIDKYFKKDSHFSNYYYKEAAINARHSNNEADEYESNFIMLLKTNKSLDINSEIRTLDGIRYYTVLKRGESMELSCLRCHSKPEVAPGQLVKKYGAKNSFNRKDKELVSVLSIRIPMEGTIRYAESLSIRIKEVLIVIIILLCIMQIILVNYFRIVNNQLKNEVGIRKAAEEELKTALEQKELLMRESDHRIKNNLFILSSLIELQYHGIQDPQVKEKFIDIDQRVNTIAGLHEQLHKSRDLVNVESYEYITTLTARIQKSSALLHSNVRIETDIDNFPIATSQIIPLGLIINELITNSYKHAFSKNDNGVISVSFKKENSNFILIVRDNGNVSADGEKRDMSYGKKMILALVKQIRGELQETYESGMCTTVAFPEGHTD